MTAFGHNLFPLLSQLPVLAGTQLCFNHLQQENKLAQQENANGYDSTVATTRLVTQRPALRHSGYNWTSHPEACTLSWRHGARWLRLD